MNIYDATEIAYKNGYKDALEDLKKVLFTGPHEFDKIVAKMLSQKGIKSE